MNLKGRILKLVVPACAVIVFAAAPEIASADRYVSHTGTAGAKDNNCSTAAYSSVQSAINAAHPGEKVYLCGTTPYTESVVIQQNLQLTGDPGATIQAPTDSRVPGTFFSGQSLQTPNAVLTVIGNVNVQVNRLTIEGPFTQTDGCGNPTTGNTDDEFGVLIIDGAMAQLNNDSVLNAAPSDASLDGCQYGVGIQVGRRYWPNTTTPYPNNYNVVNFTGNAHIQNTVVSGYAKNGITVDGPGSQSQIKSSTVTGFGPTSAVAQNGIQISRGATGELEHNSINNNEYTGPGAFASATGVLVFGGCGDPLSTNVHVHENSLTNNDSGVVLANYSANPNCVASATSPTNDQVMNNTIMKNDGETDHSPFTDQNNSAYSGYQVGIADTGNNDEIHDNKITDGPTPGAAFGPLTAPGGPFLAPIDIQTYPPINAKVHNNTFDGSPTNPPY